MAAAPDSMDLDMDIDIDIDDDPHIARLQAEAAAFEVLSVPQDSELIDTPNDIAEEGEVHDALVGNKVHISGMDHTFNTRDLENLARDHHPTAQFRRIQWIDDASANLVYDTDDAAAEALIALSAEEVADPSQSRPAKPLATHPDVQLYVRQAKESDVKVKNAHLYSTYYLHNADDPENPHGNRRKRGYNERGYRSRDYSLKRRRRDNGDDRYERRGSRDAPFDVNLYDDVPTANPASDERRPSRDSGRSHSSGDNYYRPTYEKELFPQHKPSKLRDRSASPLRDGDGRYGFAEDQPRRRTARPRSPTPPRVRAGRDNRTARDNLRKELFPDKLTSSAASAEVQDNGKLDLFPHHASPAKGPRELFPNHKRQDARDIDNEYRTVTDSMDRVSIKQNRYKRAQDEEPLDLFSRISGGPKVESSYGRLKSDDNLGFSIKGAGNTSTPDGGGFSFLGASSKERVESAPVKELFPLKASRGRSARQRAEDLF